MFIREVRLYKNVSYLQGREKHHSIVNATELQMSFPPVLDKSLGGKLFT